MRGRQRTTRGAGSKWGLALALIAIAVLVGQIVSLGEETDWSVLIEQAKSAVVWIVVETSEGTSAGSGTIISCIA